MYGAESRWEWYLHFCVSRLRQEAPTSRADPRLGRCARRHLGSQVRACRSQQHALIWFACSTSLSMCEFGSRSRVDLSVNALPMFVSLLINASLKEGSQLPYIERALRSGYGVLVLNTNDNTRNGRGIPVLHLLRRLHIKVNENSFCSSALHTGEQHAASARRVRVARVRVSVPRALRRRRRNRPVHSGCGEAHWRHRACGHRGAQRWRPGHHSHGTRDRCSLFIHAPHTRSAVSAHILF